MDEDMAWFKQYINRPELVADFQELTAAILAEKYAGTPARIEDAIDAAAEQRPDLFMAFIGRGDRTNV